MEEPAAAASPPPARNRTASFFGLFSKPGLVASPPDAEEASNANIVAAVDDSSLETWLDTSRPSSVSKAKFSHWRVADTNRQLGEEMRQAFDERCRLKESKQSNFMEAAHARMIATREQRAAAASSVKQHRERMTSQGHVTKDEVHEQIEASRDAVDAWRRHGHDMQQQLGRELSARMKSSRGAHRESMRQGALDLRQKEAERLANLQLERQLSLERKRLQVAKVREATRPVVAQTARKQFYRQRKEAADDVRESVNNWKQEKDIDTGEALERAHFNRAHALRVREGAATGMASLKKARADEAQSKRDTSRDAFSSRQTSLYLQAGKTKLMHQAAFSDRYVDAETSAVVENSDYERLSYDANPPIPTGSSEVLSARSAWNNFFNGPGWFASWWGGKAIESTRI